MKTTIAIVLLVAALFTICVRGYLSLTDRINGLADQVSAVLDR